MHTVKRVVVNEAQAVSGELIDFKKVRSVRLKRPSVAPRQTLDVDGADVAQDLDDLQWSDASWNKAIRDVEDRITKELRDGITSHDPGPILRDLRTEVTQVRSRLDQLNERIEQLCVSPAPRVDHGHAPPPPTDIGALEMLLADLAEKIDSAIAHTVTGADIVAPVDGLGMSTQRHPTFAEFTRGQATFERNAEAKTSA